MGCREEWADESHLIMHVTIEAPWTWAELMSHMEHVFGVIQAEDKPCATTVDVSRIGTMPVGNVLRHLNEIDSQMPSNVFASAIIGAPQIVSVFMEIMTRMRSHAERTALFAKTHEEAHDKILERYYEIHPSADLVEDDTPTQDRK